MGGMIASQLLERIVNLFVKPPSPEEVAIIALRVYSADQFPGTDEVWCNQHWLTKFAGAIVADKSNDSAEWLVRFARAVEKEVMESPDLLTDSQISDLAAGVSLREPK